MIELGAEVAEAQQDGSAIVALETTLVAHGFPSGEGLGVALEAERRVRQAVGRLVGDRTRRRPMIVPVVLEA